MITKLFSKDKDKKEKEKKEPPRTTLSGALKSPVASKPTPLAAKADEGYYVRTNKITNFSELYYCASGHWQLLVY